MIRLSMNVILASQKFIKNIDLNNGVSCNDIRMLYRISDIDTDDIAEMLIICKVIKKSDNNYYLTDVGENLHSVIYNSLEKSIRILLMQYVEHVAPIWSKRIPYGRFEASTFMTKDEKSCFWEAGLLSETPDISIVNWWDTVTDMIRMKLSDSRNETGRSGELLTLDYEEKRVNKKPQWKAIDSNLLGYDIMSVVSVEDSTPLLIEVKTSTDELLYAQCHITSNEWEVAYHAKTYLFYLWDIHNGIKKLAVVTPQEMACHIPQNKEHGEWESVKIPFISFEGKFKEWSLKV